MQVVKKLLGIFQTKQKFSAILLPDEHESVDGRAIVRHMKDYVCRILQTGASLLMSVALRKQTKPTPAMLTPSTIDMCLAYVGASMNKLPVANRVEFIDAQHAMTAFGKFVAKNGLCV